VHDASVRQPGVMPPAARKFSILPAAAVLVLAVLTLVSFAVVDLWVSPTTTPTTLPSIVVGTHLKVDQSTQVFGGWRVDGLPPTNIASVLIAPDDTNYVRAVPTGGAGVDYDMAVDLSVAAPRAELLGFYRSNLELIGWQLFSTGPAPGGGGDELIFEKGGDNGDDWDCGVIARATTSGRTTYEFRLFDVGDDE
jgi:hypothetical protein